MRINETIIDDLLTAFRGPNVPGNSVIDRPDLS
jgi:hypothetical protein